MNKSFIFIMLTGLTITSCPPKRARVDTKGTFSITETGSDTVALFSIDSLRISGPAYRLCKQKITSPEAILELDMASENDLHYDEEKTSVFETFFFPEKDIVNSDLVKNVQLRYNYANVLYRILHGYELFCRKSSDDSLATRRDSMNLIIQDCPVIPHSFLQRSIPDKSARIIAEKLLVSYRAFDGREHSNSAFDKAHAEFVEGMNNLPKIVDEALLKDFEENFWDWYDKRKYVPEYDRIVALYLNDDIEKTELTENEERHLKLVIEGEQDINRRTILALELVRNSRDGFRDATQYLGEILESGIYTKYILEAWLAWRAAVQLEFFSPSSFSLIPNNYYDKIRVKCLNTILRHIQNDPDKYDVCLLENFIYCEILHRMDAIYGNEAMTVIARLTDGMFIQPSALGKDYLNEN